jgi:predicted MFS family arabinose efflux permease
MLTLTPWNTTDVLEWFNYASGNDERIAVVENSEKTIVVLNNEKELIFKLNAASHPTAKSFFDAESLSLDENNNLYVLDKNFGGAFDENVERILKYSPEGKFLDEVYAYHYVNEDFIITKGKISGMTYFDGAVYLVRLENDGFYLERASSAKEEAELIQYFAHPNAFQDLVYSRINAETKRITFTTRARGIRQYDFSGELLGEWPGESTVLPWSAASDNDDNIIYADIVSGEIIFIDTATDERTVLFASPEGRAYSYVNYANQTFFATSDDDIFIMDESGEFETITFYIYPSSLVTFRTILFALCLLAALVFIVLILTFVFMLSEARLGESLKRILLVGGCVAFGAAISSVIIINQMNERYYENTYTDLENVSRLMADTIDIDTITSISSSTQYESEEYRRLSNTLKRLLAQLPVQGMKVYQYIWMERDGTVYSMYDSENAMGILYPFFEYEDSYYQEVAETKQYVYTNDITAAGSWLFACGPIFDSKGNVVAEIETGYSMSMVLEQTRNMIIQTVLIVIATTIAFLLIMIECILIMNAYKQNKHEWVDGASMPFRPELLRAIVFFQFFAANLATALLPMYAARLYEPIFNLPQEFVVTFPFTANVIFVVLSQLAVPNLIKRAGIRQIGFLAVLFFVIGNGLCFAATNMVYLSLGYAFIGFSGGTLVLVINAIISAQRNVEEVNSGFAHYNASYLAGVNVGVVCGSIIAQFFPYRIVFLFATIFAVVLFAVFVFSIRSKYLRYFYDMTREKRSLLDSKDTYEKDKKNKRLALLKFISNPLVLVTLLLVLLPYVSSISFTEYFLPIFGTNNGLGESNIGQLILLSGLFAILFGTSLCEYFGRKLPLRMIMILALLLNAGAVYLFSLQISIFMMIVAVVIIAIANIFALTNIQTYYATLYQGTKVSSMTALSIYAMVENAAMAIGPIIFSYILAFNIAGGMRIFSLSIAAGLLLFVVISTVFGKKKRKGLLGRALQIKEGRA